MMLLAAILAMVAGSVAYHYGYFRLASLLGLGIAAALMVVLPRELGHTPGWIVFAILVLFPTLCVAVHAFDAKRGYFLIPTVYAIQIAFGCAIIDLVIATVASVV